MIKYFKKSKGFSLTELLIVIFIIILFSALSVFALSNVKQKRQVKVVAEEVRDKIQEARSFAISSDNQNGKVHKRIKVIINKKNGTDPANIKIRGIDQNNSANDSDIGKTEELPSSINFEKNYEIVFDAENSGQSGQVIEDNGSPISNPVVVRIQNIDASVIYEIKVNRYGGVEINSIAVAEPEPELTPTQVIEISINQLINRINILGSSTILPNDPEIQNSILEIEKAGSKDINLAGTKEVYIFYASLPDDNNSFYLLTSENPVQSRISKSELDIVKDLMAQKMVGRIRTIVQGQIDSGAICFEENLSNCTGFTNIKNDPNIKALIDDGIRRFVGGDPGLNSGWDSYAAWTILPSDKDKCICADAQNETNIYTDFGKYCGQNQLRLFCAQ